jgi:cell shape-determining protein MreC
LEKLTLEYSSNMNISLEKTTEMMAKLKETMMQVYEAVKNIVAKFFETFKQFLSNNQLLVKYILKNEKYKKRIKNRNKLYWKCKKLGRTL